jgi:hypothetical protein
MPDPIFATTGELPTIDKALADPDLPQHVRAFLEASLKRHPLVAWNDAQLVAELLKKRYETTKAERPAGSAN